MKGFRAVLLPQKEATKIQFLYFFHSVGNAVLLLCVNLRVQPGKSSCPFFSESVERNRQFKIRRWTGELWEL